MKSILSLSVIQIRNNEINICHKMIRIHLLLICLILTFCAKAQLKKDSSDISKSMFTLGVINVTEIVDKEMVSIKEMNKYNASDVSTSLKSLPSVTYYSSGSRNESMVLIRGSDLRSIPVFVDGIPVYVPFDGYVDLGRFTTFDISKIDVSKGFASIMYGANTIGGAINLVGQKPIERIEIRGEAGLMSGNGYNSGIYFGSHLGKVYFLGNFSIFDRQFIPLSADFDTTALETNHRLDNSYRKDIKGSFKVGFTPNQTDEYSLNYTVSHGSKGNPIYLGNDPRTNVRYWQWPNWDKQSIYFISETSFNKVFQMRIRAYYDEFKNKIRSFDDNTYTTQTKKSSFNSYYNDFSLGGNIELNGNFSDANTLKFMIHLKNDNHRENNEGEPVRQVSDNTLSIGLEEIYRPTKKLTFVPGISYNLRKSIGAEDYNSKTQEIIQLPENSNYAINAQVASYYTLSKSIGLNFNVAYKSRFATMKDRYSYRAGFAIPNPELESESALNLEIGGNISIGEVLKFRPEIFYNRVFNTIQIVTNVQDDLYQMQNTGSSEFKGADFSFTYLPIRMLKIYGSYSYIKCQNLSNPDLIFTDIPSNKIYASTEMFPIADLSISVSGEYNTKRFSNSDGTRVSPAFFVSNAEVAYKFLNNLELIVGINNILDSNYTIQEGYPEPGRNIYAKLHLNFSK